MNYKNILSTALIAIGAVLTLGETDWNNMNELFFFLIIKIVGLTSAFFGINMYKHEL